MDIPVTERSHGKNYTGPRPMLPLNFERPDGTIFTPALVEDCYTQIFYLLGKAFGGVPLATLKQIVDLPTAHERARRLAELLEAGHGKPEQS